jgi:thiamine biosynthesis lipoprotein ApbE
MTTQPAPLTTHAEPVMGTVFSFTAVHGDLPPDGVRAALAAACRVLHHCDALFSTWDPASAVSRFRRGEAELGQLPPEFPEVLRECRAAKQASGGWFDPWAMPGGFDPTGLVKGWATERALAELRGAGLAGALINGGGDVAVFGSPADGQRWRVGIRHPWRADALACVIEAGQGPVTEERGLEPAGGSGGSPPRTSTGGVPGRLADRTGTGGVPGRLADRTGTGGVPGRLADRNIIAAVATSGPYERGAHLIDPATGQPASRAASATVTGPSLALADALATGVAVGGDEALALVAGLEGYAGYLIRPDGSETDTGGIAFAR